MLRVVELVASGAELLCNQGTTPAALTVPRPRRSSARTDLLAVVDDHVPLVHLAPFGACRCPANPAVAAATAAAMGILTPAPCMPVVPLPWSLGAARLTFDGVLALTADSTVKCAYSGTISVLDSKTDVESV